VNDRFLIGIALQGILPCLLPILDSFAKVPSPLEVHGQLGGANPNDTLLSTIDFADEFTLRSAVAFAKWMARVQFAEKVRSAFGKLFSVPAGEIIPGRQFSERLLEG